jgi:hypothetical protein
MDWELIINLALPHERFRIGWEILQATEEEPYVTISIDLLFINFTLNYG